MSINIINTLDKKLCSVSDNVFRHCLKLNNRIYLLRNGYLIDTMKSKLLYKFNVRYDSSLLIHCNVYSTKTYYSGQNNVYHINNDEYYIIDTEFNYKTFIFNRLKFKYNDNNDISIEITKQKLEITHKPFDNQTGDITFIPKNNIIILNIGYQTETLKCSYIYDFKTLNLINTFDKYHILSDDIDNNNVHVFRNSPFLVGNCKELNKSFIYDMKSNTIIQQFDLIINVSFDFGYSSKDDKTDCNQSYICLETKDNIYQIEYNDGDKQIYNINNENDDDIKTDIPKICEENKNIDTIKDNNNNSIEKKYKTELKKKNKIIKKLNLDIRELETKNKELESNLLDKCNELFELSNKFHS